MSVTNGVISLDSVRVAADAAYVLGLTNPGVGYICSNEHGKINMWSRYKPIRHGTPFPDRSGAYYRGQNGQCGLNLVNAYVSNYAFVKEKLDTGYPLCGWEYLPPQSEYCIVDMCGYDNNAQPVLKSFSVSTEVVKGKKMVGSCIMNGDNTTNPGSLSIHDIQIGGKLLANWKLGVVVYDANGNRKGRVVDTGLGGVEFDTSLLTAGQTYYAYPFIAEFAMGQNDTDIANSYYVLPYTTKQAFKVITAAEAVGIVITFTGTMGLGVTWNLDITTQQDVQVIRGHVELRFASNAWNDSLLTGEYQTALGAFNITSAKPYSKTGTFFQADSRPDYVLRLHLETSAGTFDREAAIISQIAPSL